MQANDGEAILVWNAVGDETAVLTMAVVVTLAMAPQALVTQVLQALAEEVMVARALALERTNHIGNEYCLQETKV